METAPSPELTSLSSYVMAAVCHLPPPLPQMPGGEQGTQELASHVEHVQHHGLIHRTKSSCWSNSVIFQLLQMRVSRRASREKTCEPCTGPQVLGHPVMQSQRHDALPCNPFLYRPCVLESQHERAPAELARVLHILLMQAPSVLDQAALAEGADGVILV